LSLSKASELEVPSGSHHVEMYVAWALPARMGPAQVDVSLEDGDVVELRYQPPWDPDEARKAGVVSAGP